MGVLYRSDASGGRRAGGGSAASLATAGSEAEAVDDAVVAWLAAAGYPPAEAAQVLAGAGGDIDLAAERLFTAWTGASPHCLEYSPRASHSRSKGGDDAGGLFIRLMLSRSPQLSKACSKCMQLP